MGYSQEQQLHAQQQQQQNVGGAQLAPNNWPQWQQQQQTQQQLQGEQQKVVNMQHVNPSHNTYIAPTSTSSSFSNHRSAPYALPTHQLKYNNTTATSSQHQQQYPV